MATASYFQSTVAFFTAAIMMGGVMAGPDSIFTRSLRSLDPTLTWVPPTSSTTTFLTAIFLLNGVNFGEAPNVARFVGKSRGDESVHQFLRHRFTDHTSTEHQHVHVVMFDALVRGVRIVAEACADARNFIGRHRRSH